MTIGREGSGSVPCLHYPSLFFTIYAIFIAVVKKKMKVNIVAEFEADAIRVLRSIPELNVVTARAWDSGSDAFIQYGDTETPVAIEFKTRVSSATAHLLVHQARRLKIPMVVIAATMTSKAREILAEAGVGSVDGLGNVRLELPGLIIRITSTKRAHPSAVPTRLSGKSGLIAQAMLLDIDRYWHVSDLAERCAVSAGLAHRVLRRLEGEGIVEALRSGPNKTRRLSNPPALLDLWAEENRDRPLRQPSFLLAQTSDHLISSLCDGLETAGVDYALTGSAAAARIAPFLTDVPIAEVWLASTADARDVGAELGAAPVGAGPNVVFLQERDDGPLAFRTRENGVWMVNVFRLYVDVRRNPRRGREQGDHLRREVIRF